MSRTDEADRLLRILVRERVRCERCQAMGTDVAHILRRRYNATRCDERNVWFLCRWCHSLVDSSVPVHADLVRSTIGTALFRELLDLAQAGSPMPLSAWWPAERARLRARLRELGLPLRGAAA